MGPIQILLLGFEDFHATSDIADELGALNNAGTIRIIDAHFLLRDSPTEIVAVSASDLHDSKHKDLRAAAAALASLGHAAALNEDGTTEWPTLGAGAALDIAELGLCEAEIGELAEQLNVGDALLLLIIENVWATGLADALRTANIVFAQQDYLSTQGLRALANLLHLNITLDN